MFPLLHPWDSPRARRPQGRGAICTICLILQGISIPWKGPFGHGPRCPGSLCKAPTPPLLSLTWSRAVRSPAPGTSEEESFPAPHHGKVGRLSVDSPYG